MELYIRLQESLYDSVRIEKLYKILTELGIPMKPAGLIKTCSYENL
jgi:hypothetical protein